jgi:rRNA maturation endonuclease Nob1
MKLFFLITGLLAIGVFGMAVKIIFKKDGKFDKTCASASRIFDDDEGGECSFCGATADEKCKSDEVESAA